jgi:hypothetical protein
MQELGRRLIYTCACVAALAIPAAAGGATGATAAHAPYICTSTGSGVITFYGGGFLSARRASYTYTGLDTGCHLPDPTIHSGTEVGGGSGTLSCGRLRALFTGKYTEYWDNGRKSVGVYTERILAGGDYTTGVFIAGEFNGMASTYAGLDIPLNPTACFSKVGPMYGGFAGQFLFS